MVEVVCSEQIKNYFDKLQQQIEKEYSIATEARKLNVDPEGKVDILLAEAIAQRVEGLISAIAPTIVGSGVAQRIEELQKIYGPGDWRVGLKIAEEIAKQKFIKFETELEAISVGIRSGLAYTTQAVVSAPIEGIIDIKLKKRADGRDYLAIYYGGPIRGAGGTHQGVSVIIADYVRRKMNIADYDPTEDEVKRYFTETIDYYERVERKQYKPLEEEMNFIIKNIKVELNGDAGSEKEVSNYKNLPRVETNNIRTGLALVLTDGLPLKAAKIWKQLNKWGKDFDLEDWKWMDDFLKLKAKLRAGEAKKESTENKLTPNYYYISEIVAGRPVFGYPLERGGFRLRYGRSRMTGDGSWAVSPVTMRILLDYLATGTQMRVERPGKSTALSVCDHLDGPVVVLKDGTVLYLDSEEEAIKVRNKIERILYLGDILISRGDFSEQGTKLVPAGYCEEWWLLELSKAITDKQIANPAEFLGISNELFEQLNKNPIKTKISLADAIKISKLLSIPLHPQHTYHWIELSVAQIKQIRAEVLASTNNTITNTPEIKNSLELIGCPHELSNGKIKITDEQMQLMKLLFSNESNKENNLEYLSESAGIKIRDKSGTFIGTRMGRPEKGKIRKLKGSPTVLFPVGKEGGRYRSMLETLKQKVVTADFPLFFCNTCQLQTIYPTCERCGTRTTLHRVCPICKKMTDKMQCHKDTIAYTKRKLDITHYFNHALKMTGLSQPPEIRGVKGTWNKDHLTEYLPKGILRTQNNLYVNKDGTIRYDMTELGVTHFKPNEIGLSIQKAKELGYEKDIYGKEITSEDQVIELKPQDVILPKCTQSDQEGADKVLLRIMNFVDDELEKIYKLPRFYNATKTSDVIGHLVIGLAPHTSAGILGRVLGFSETQACYAHPYWHDAQRRDLDGEETAIMLTLDAFLNFSRQYLPDRRGARSMDAPLVLTTKILPAEIDDEVYDVDTAWSYPLEFYEATLEYKNPWDIKIEQIKNRIGKPEQYEGFGYTHPVTSINMGVLNSAYKSIPTMLEKLQGQLELADKIRAVNRDAVAELVINGHFIRDIKGNLRKFTQQGFRCINCNEKYRRVPISGICTECSGKIVFTIAEGTIKKYLEPSINLGNYCPNYMKQTLSIVKRRIESIFGREETKQVGLQGFFNS